MNLQKVEEIKKFAKKQEFVFVKDVMPIIKSSRVMALNYLLEMELQGILERIEIRKSQKYSYKKWRIKKNV